MTKLVLIKHSLPSIDPSVAAAKWQLSAQGVERCSRLADLLHQYLPATLISSPEPKARATAAYLAHYWSINYTTRSGLEEHHRHSVAFLSERGFHSTIQTFFARPSELVFGEESASQAEQRFSAAIERLLVHQHDRNLMVVTHGTVMSLYLARRSGLEAFVLWQQLGLPSFVVFDPQTQTFETGVMQIGEEHV